MAGDNVADSNVDAVHNAGEMAGRSDRHVLAES